MSKKIAKKVLVFGTFDYLHKGHHFFLDESAKHGLLTIVVASKEVVKKIKGKSPTSIKKRVADLKRLGVAEKIIPGEKKINSWKILKKEKPDIIAVGYDQKDFAEALGKIQKDYGFKVKMIKSFMPKKYHSSIINNLKS